MVTWFLHWQWKRRIKKDTSDFKIKNESEAIRSSCIKEILDSTKDDIKNAEYLYEKITKRIKARDKHYITRDIMGNEIKLKNPIFTQSEISQVSKTIRKYYFTIILFVVFETLLWLFAADAFFPELPNIAKYLISFILGVGLMLLIEKGFGNLSEYKEALLYKETGQMDDPHFRKYKSKRTIGYFLIGLVILVIIGLGIARVILLTPTSSGLFTSEEFERLKLFNIIAPIALSVLSIGIAIYMGSAKLDQSAYKIKYDAYKKWREHNKKTNSHITKMRDIVAKLSNTISSTIEKSWQLIIDLKRICGLEYDTRFQKEYVEYIDEKRKNDFVLNDEVYRKFENIISVDQSLYNYGIESNKEIKQIREKINQYNQIVIQVEKEYSPQDA
jgi:hypothetical protein